MPSISTLYIIVLWIYAGVFFIALVYSRDLNGAFQLAHPSKRPFTWGFFISIAGVLISAIAGYIYFLDVILGPSKDVYMGVVKAATVYYFMFKRNRTAWVIGTIGSLNPILWVINGIYLKHRWQEMDPSRKEE